MADLSVTIKLLGGLGNQMFQYAAALALAKKKKANLFLDISEFDSYKAWPYLLGSLNVPQNIAPKATDKNFSTNLLYKILYKFGFSKPVSDCGYSEPHYHFDPAFFDSKPPVVLSGYFQSEHYFSEIRKDLLQDFSLKEPMSDLSQSYMNIIKNTEIPVSLHVRRGDYVSNQAALKTHGLATAEYYRHAVNIFDNLYENVTYFIFSDDLDYVEQNFDFCKNRVLVRGASDRPYEDMWLMASCHHNIIANSSFSWWGAWLNEHEDKRVIAPRNWFSRTEMLNKNVMDVCPDGWILL